MEIYIYIYIYIQADEITNEITIKIASFYLLRYKIKENKLKLINFLNMKQ